MSDKEIRELSVHARPSNKKAQRISFVLLLGAAACIISCCFILNYQIIPTVFTVVLASTAIMIYTRYIAASYLYDITVGAEGEPIFVVRSRTGRRETTLLRVDLYAIKSIERLTREDKKAYKCDTGVVRYNYCPTLFPDTSVLLTVRSQYENADVFIEITDEFCEYLSTVSTEAKENYLIDND